MTKKEQQNKKKEQWSRFYRGKVDYVHTLVKTTTSLLSASKTPVTYFKRTASSISDVVLIQ